ncbi:ATP phosphoribosyltransferase domain protein [Escherichia coli DEC2B]|uniref:ATP phosphoribosyltransferase domain protein n=1 Tax=Escherichia coli DEC2D TaxID=868141 RepID=A0A828U4F4_ECOLX|nr:hypothetical protein EC236275_3074 [Escherichia coli 2362-75]EHU09822.1 ATP phosphoribosyltransferase domain protein [Escherichia coli DEC1A]EHU10134.1 ATP phosphoribosyltransferase domain protein [Escherichia coli DEC1C]EHU13568.1 ATP phosphoribosyltransferase domain protein [Escherichia coli DEC1B]EHU23035.1 hypothetical protein ECDEC1D_2738 [Escherichia coli DEC1D]EHU26396.1 ATP phosphoribosyltransferase domain protein [Escherichia coli DEC1E]EHU28810.1 hypothetical protein ECDEC2A_2524
MLEDIQIFQWCMNAWESPRKITFRGLFYCAVVNGSDRFKEE